MSSHNSVNNDIGGRILRLKSLFSTDKDFLNKCEIKNYSLITDIRKGRISSPGSEIVAQIVRGTGCSGTWLLTGEGEMFEPRTNADAAPERDANLAYAFTLLEKIEQKANGITDIELPPDIELRLTRLLLKVLEHRQEDR